MLSAMTLDDYLRRNLITVSEFARAADVQRQTVYYWLAGRVPSRPYMRKIMLATGGKVKLEDFEKGNGHA
jgi:predicted transcriptional regulator